MRNETDTIIEDNEEDAHTIIKNNTNLSEFIIWLRSDYFEYVSSPRALITAYYNNWLVFCIN